MPIGPRLILKNACYHIMTRGNQKQKIFLDEQDCHVYINRLKKYKLKHHFLLYSFCLIPNHVHLIGESQESTGMSKFMHGLNLSYTAYFNNKYKKVGHLWQGRFKSKAIVKDNYLLDCMQYIELNPVRAKLVKHALDYPWSSYKQRIFAEATNRSIVDGLRF